jgi:CRISPR-associated protein Csm4
LEETMFVDTRGVRRARIDISLYVKVADENWAAEARTLLEQLAHSGYGARKTVGYGHFELVRWEPFSGFQEPSSTTNGFISLSNWVPAHGDPQEGFYNTLVKYGKLGEELSRSENPFKFPLTMLTAGSAFYAHPPIEPWYGRLVQNIAPGDERVVQYAYAFAVPAHLAAERLGSEL